MGRDETFKQQERRLKEYEMVSNRNLEKQDTQLGYRDMNTRFLNAEKQELENRKNADVNKIMEAHAQKKKQIESAWHTNTTNSVKELKKRAPKKGSEKTAAYYAGYSMKDLEVFLKNSDRGGNSDEFNDVATDLELYNRVMDSADAREGMGLLLQLKESCSKYLTTRKSPVTSNGKIRKAIISQLSQKVETELEKQRNDYLNAQKNTLEAMREETNAENVNAAMKAHYELVFQSLSGNIQLTPEEMNKLDMETEEVLKELKKQDVDKNQSNSLCSKFFNAIGWSGNDPRIVGYDEFHGKEMENSPHKKLCYHSIDPLPIYEDGKVVGTEKNALPQAKQLAGFSKEGKRIYYGIGRFGKGVYTAARDDSPGATDQEAKSHSWTYGAKKGAVMFTMLLNEHARITTEKEMLDRTEELMKKFPRIFDFIRKNEVGRFRDYTTIYAAFLGYNTIIGDGTKNVEYISTSDRKALTMFDKIEVRTDEEDDLYTDDVSLTELKNAENSVVENNA